MTVLDLSHHNQPGTPDNAQAVIIRGAYGLTPDKSAPEHNSRADSAGLPRMFYWYPLSRRDPVKQALTAFTQSGGETGRRGWVDLEESTANDGAEPVFPRYSESYWQHVNAGLVTIDSRTGLTAGIYSSAAWLNWWFTADQQTRWANATATRPGRFLWVAHWIENGFPPKPDMPQGWQTYALWQTGKGPWPGMTGNVDQSQLGPGTTLTQLLGVTPPTPPSDDPDVAQIRAHAAAILELTE